MIIQKEILITNNDNNDYTQSQGPSNSEIVHKMIDAVYAIQDAKLNSNTISKNSSVSIADKTTDFLLAMITKYENR